MDIEDQLLKYIKTQLLIKTIIFCMIVSFIYVCSLEGPMFVLIYVMIMAQLVAVLMGYFLSSLSFKIHNYRAASSRKYQVKVATKFLYAYKKKCIKSSRYLHEEALEVEEFLDYYYFGSDVKSPCISERQYLDMISEKVLYLIDIVAAILYMIITVLMINPVIGMYASRSNYRRKRYVEVILCYWLIPIILYRKLKKNYIEKIVRESVKRNLSGKLFFDKDIKLLKGYEYLKVEVN